MEISSKKIDILKAFTSMDIYLIDPDKIDLDGFDKKILYIRISECICFYPPTLADGTNMIRKC